MSLEAAYGQFSIKRVQKYEEFFIGIDFSKEKFDATLIVNGNGAEAIMVSHEVFSNKKAGFADCIRWMRRETGKAMPEEVLLCGEDTGRYSDAFSGLFLWSRIRPVA